MRNNINLKDFLPATSKGRAISVIFMSIVAGSGIGGMTALKSTQINAPTAADITVARNAVIRLKELATLPKPQLLDSVTNPVARFALSECQTQFSGLANSQHVNICLLNKAENFNRFVLKPLEVKPVGQGPAVAKGIGFGGLAGGAFAVLMPLIIQRRKPEALSA